MAPRYPLEALLCADAQLPRLICPANSAADPHGRQVNKISSLFDIAGVAGGEKVAWCKCLLLALSGHVGGVR
jgi:hypothetical protein